MIYFVTPLMTQHNNNTTITLTPTIRSSVDDLLRHTPDAVNESSALEEEEVANNLDHTNR